MRLRIFSDLHLEFQNFEPPHAAADVVILAGDIHVGTNGIRWAQTKFAETPVIYILGNHEYYGKALPKLRIKMRECAAGSKVHVLENERLVIGDITFLGCTLWTDFRLFGDPRIAGYEATQAMTDYRRIRVSPTYRKLRSVDTASEHHKSLEWLRAELNTCTPDRTVIVTHHAPSAKSLPPSHREDILSAAYASNLEDFVAACGVPLWIHGHLHCPSDYTLGSTRVLCNPRGYPDEPNPEFNPSLVVHIDRAA